MFTDEEEKKENSESDKKYISRRLSVEKSDSMSELPNFASEITKKPYFGFKGAQSSRVPLYEDSEFITEPLETSNITLV